MRQISQGRLIFQHETTKLETMEIWQLSRFPCRLVHSYTPFGLPCTVLSCHKDTVILYVRSGKGGWTLRPLWEKPATHTQYKACKWNVLLQKVNKITGNYTFSFGSYEYQPGQNQPKIIIESNIYTHFPGLQFKSSSYSSLDKVSLNMFIQNTLKKTAIQLQDVYGAERI